MQDFIKHLSGNSNWQANLFSDKEPNPHDAARFIELNVQEKIKWISGALNCIHSKQNQSSSNSLLADILDPEIMPFVIEISKFIFIRKYHNDVTNVLK